MESNGRFECPKFLGQTSKMHETDSNHWREDLLQMATINQGKGLAANYLVVLVALRWKRKR